VKKVIGALVGLLLAITLLPACDDTQSGYTGFPAPAAGQWAEYIITTGGESHLKMEYIGQDTVDGKTCTGFEMTMSGEEETIMQIWTETATGQAVKYVVKMGDEAICMDVSESPYEPPETETPGTYDPNLPNISYGTYTTPTGKTVNVAKFAAGGGEVWVSSQVPFGMVKVIADGGQTPTSLYDFGMTGAQRDISKTEMENCIEYNP